MSALLEGKEDEVQKRSLSEEEVAELDECFAMVDVDRTGFIDHEEMVDMLSTLSLKPPETEINAIFHELRAHESDKVYKTEFRDFMRYGVVKNAARADLLKCFRRFEQLSGGSKKAGRVDREALAAMLAAYVPDKLASAEDAQQLVQQMSIDSSGQVDYGSFVCANTPTEVERAALLQERAQRAPASRAQSSGAPVATEPRQDSSVGKSRLETIRETTAGSQRQGSQQRHEQEDAEYHRGLQQLLDDEEGEEQPQPQPQPQQQPQQPAVAGGSAQSAAASSGKPAAGNAKRGMQSPGKRRAR